MNLLQVGILLLVALSYTSSKYIDKDNEWEYLVFTQTWSAASCMEFNHEHRSCTLEKDLNKWGIHGIWPNNEDKTGPFFCDHSWKFNESAIADIESELDKRWPNIINDTPHTNFWKHEWEKHGTCAASLETLNSEHKYFSKGIELNKMWDLAKVLEGAGIVPSKETPYDMRNIKKTIEAKSQSASNVGCIKVDGVQMLVQVEICMNKQFETIDCDDSHANKHGKLLWFPNIKVYPCGYDEPTYYVLI